MRKNFLRIVTMTIIAIIFSAIYVCADTPNTTSYRDLLDERQQSIYDKICTLIETDNSNWTWTDVPFYISDKDTIISFIVHDKTEFEYGSFTIYYYYKGNKIKSFSIVTQFNKTDYASMYSGYKLMYEDNRNILIDKINKLNSAEEKIKYIHDYICDNTNYSKYSTFNQYAFSVYVNRTSVCAGYSKAFKDLCNAVGIECYCVNGKTTANKNTIHAWNAVVNDDGEVRYYDVTWDDESYDIYFENTDKVYDYYDKTLEEIGTDHFLSDESIKLINSIKNRKENENEI